MTGQRFNVREASTASPVKGEGGEGSSGSTKTVACHQRSVIELGTAASCPATGTGDQPQEDAGIRDQPSDRPIVVGDGRTDHTPSQRFGAASGMAKGPANGQRQQSTHAGKRPTPTQSVSRTLLALNEKAKREPGHRFRGLGRLISLPMLHECYHSLSKRAASGVDGVSWHDYGEGLSEKLSNLHDRLRTGRYRAPHVRRHYIPKADGKRRALGIPALEDKIVQKAAAQILSAIYEADFLPSSAGYRPGRGPRGASQQLQHELYHSAVGWVVEADIKGFFDHVDHDWLERMLARRIHDRGFLRLIRKWLRAGVLEEDGKILHPATGTPQGGIVSPILANIYLHHVLDLWLERQVRRESVGQMVHLRYADDFVVGFEREEDARECLRRLPERLAKFGLTLAADKSGIVRFDRQGGPSNGRFAFLGFDFYWSRTRNGKPTLRRRTSGKKFARALTDLKGWLIRHRHTRLRTIAAVLKAKLTGHYNYYGVIGNATRLGAYWIAVQKLWYRQLNRRSQRHSYNWTGFNEMWQSLCMPPPRVMETPYVPPGMNPCWF
jgi:RNA-directed DNA polymerase